MIELLKEKIKNKNFKNVIILTGAGMGVDSGLPDYRSKEGFWKEFPMAKEMGISFEDSALPSWFRIDPKEAWTFYGYRTNLYKKARPHEGFDLLKEFIADKDYFIITSNIDNMFQKSGFDQNKIFEMHGNLFTLQCTKVKGLFYELGCLNSYKNEEYTGVVPMCECGYALRPNIQMFGDHQWNSSFYDLQEERLKLFIKNIANETLIIEIGAGTALPFIRNYSDTLKRTIPGSFFVRINPFECEGNANLSLKEKAVNGLKLIFS